MGLEVFQGVLGGLTLWVLRRVSMDSYEFKGKLTKQRCMSLCD